MADTAAPARIPFVDYLVLDDGDPHLVAHECTSCGARYFDRRNACAGCFGTEFRTAPIATAGEVRSFTIVTFAAPGVEVPNRVLGASNRWRDPARDAPATSRGERSVVWSEVGARTSVGCRANRQLAAGHQHGSNP